MRACCLGNHLGMSPVVLIGPSVNVRGGILVVVCAVVNWMQSYSHTVISVTFIDAGTVVERRSLLVTVGVCGSRASSGGVQSKGRGP